MIVSAHESQAPFAFRPLPNDNAVCAVVQIKTVTTTGSTVNLEPISYSPIAAAVPSLQNLAIVCANLFGLSARASGSVAFATLPVSLLPLDVLRQAVDFDSYANAVKTYYPAALLIPEKLGVADRFNWPAQNVLMQSFFFFTRAQILARVEEARAEYSRRTVASADPDEPNMAWQTLVNSKLLEWRNALAAVNQLKTRADTLSQQALLIMRAYQTDPAKYSAQMGVLADLQKVITDNQTFADALAGQLTVNIARLQTILASGDQSAALPTDPQMPAPAPLPTLPVMPVTGPGAGTVPTAAPSPPVGTVVATPAAPVVQREKSSGAFPVLAAVTLLLSLLN